jgi:AcrR family transcriptional regulator
MAHRAGVDRQGVIRAAYELVDALGPAALTLTVLAAKLGIRTPSLYNHIDGLQGLQRDLALAGTRELRTTIAQAVLGKSRDVAVLALAYAYRGFVGDHRGIYELMLQAARAGHEPDRELDAAAFEVVEVALAVLAGYGLEGTDALHAVRGLRSVVHGFATLEVAGNFGLPLDVEESFRRLMDMHIRGLRNVELS